MKKATSKPSPLDSAKLTRIATNDDWFYYKSTKRVPCDRIGWFHSNNTEELNVSLVASPTTPLGRKLRTQAFWVNLTDDDDWYAHKEFFTFDSALDFYIKTPSIIDWGWVSGHKFTF